MSPDILGNGGRLSGKPRFWGIGRARLLDGLYSAAFMYAAIESSNGRCKYEVMVPCAATIHLQLFANRHRVTLTNLEVIRTN